MIHYDLPWLFYFSYNNQNESVNIRYSSTYLEKHQDLPEHEYKTLEEITSWIHKYDLRKLSYFSNQEQLEFFDTVFRFNIKHKKKYLRAQSICKKTEEGFSCLAFDEFDVVMLKRKINQVKVYPTESTLNIHLSNDDSYEWANESGQMISHVLDIVDRET